MIGMQYFSRFRLGLLLSQIILVSLVYADCYSHDGILALNSRYYTGPELVSCGNGTNTCCLKGEKCGSNLLCAGSNYIARQYCADVNWTKCSSACSDAVAAGVVLTECPVGSNTYCCGNGNNCSTCNRIYIDPSSGAVSSGAVKAPTGVPLYWQVDSSSILAAKTAGPSASSTGSNSALSSSALRSTATLSTGLPTTSSTSSSSTSSPSAAPSPQPTGLSTGAKAGIGIGCAVGALVIIGLLALLFRERRKRKASQPQDAHAQPIPPPYPGYANDPTKESYMQTHGAGNTQHELDGTSRVAELR